MRQSARFSALFISLIFALSMHVLADRSGQVRFVSSQGQSETSVRHKVIGCAKEPRGECVGDECSCSKWIIEWRDSSGSVWGLSEAKSLQKLIEARDRDLAFERAYAKFFQVPFDQKFANPSQPICDGCRPSAPSEATRSGAAAMQTAASLYDEWTRKLAEGVISLTNVILGWQTTYLNSPYRNAGTVLRDYANALRLVNRNLKHLRQDMSFTEREMGRLTGNLGNSIAELRQATDVMATAYANLPSDVRNALEGKGPTGQAAGEVSFYDQWRYGRRLSQYHDGVLTVKADTTWIKWGSQGAFTARVSDLDLENARIAGGVICRDRDCGSNFEPDALQHIGPREREMYVLSIDCKAGNQCVSVPGYGTYGRIDLYCETRQACSDFLDVLKGRRK